MTSSILLNHEDMDRARIASFLFGEVSIFSRRCPGKDKDNEDALLICPVNGNSGVLAVADGMGGLAKGDVAAELTLATLREVLQSCDDSAPGLRESILDAIELANQRVLDLGSGSGTTLSILEFDGSRVRPYQIGDSAIVLTGQRGKIKLETLSHSPTGYGVEAGMLGPEDAIHHEERHIVTNFIGSSTLKVEMGSWVEFANLDTAILASDGLTDNLYIPEIVETIRAGKLDDVSDQLISQSASRMASVSVELPGKPDDLSFIIFRSTKE